MNSVVFVTNHPCDVAFENKKHLGVWVVDRPWRICTLTDLELDQ